MNKNLICLFEILLNDSEIRKNFAKQKNLNDAYKICNSVVGGYSFDEFIEFLKAIITINSQISNKIIDKELESVTGGLDFSNFRAKITTILLGSILLVGETSQSLAYGIGEKEISQNIVSVGQKVEYSQKYDIESKIEEIKNNVSESTKQVINILAETAEICIGTALDTVTPSVSAVETKIVPSINSWPTASNITVGQTVGDSKLSGGSANVPGSFSWFPTIANEKLHTIGEVSYVCQFVPRDTKNYTKATETIYFKVLQGNPKINSFPTASSITYGQKLSDSKLSGGSANVAGKFEWKDSSITPNAGEKKYKVAFTPYDSSNYNGIFIDVPVYVEKAPVKITSYPSVSSITYGQSLSSSIISNFNTNVPGTASWLNPGEVLNAGTHMRSIVFTPYDYNNYKTVSITAQIIVNKVIPKLNDKRLQIKYKPGMILNDLPLPEGWLWETPNVPLDNIGEFKFVATHPGNNNYNNNNETLIINIDKAEPKLSISDIIYNEKRTLKDIELPLGWHWIDENEVPSVSKSTYKASFSSQEAGTKFYHDRSEIDLKINIKKADPGVEKWAEPTANVKYGDNIEDIRLGNGKTKVSGKFKLLNCENTELKVGDRQLKIVFTPDNPNYETKTGTINIKVLKNMNPAEPPQKISPDNVIRGEKSIKFEISGETYGIEFSKDGGNTWQDSAEFTNLSPKTEYSFVHRFKDNESRCASKISPVLKISTKDSAPAAPKELKVKKKTNHEIIFENNNQLEFSIDNGKTWQQSSEFKNLRGSTKYTFIARFKATDDHIAGLSSNPVTVKTRSWIGNIFNKVFRN